MDERNAKRDDTGCTNEKKLQGEQWVFSFVETGTDRQTVYVSMLIMQSIVQMLANYCDAQCPALHKPL